MAGVNPYASAPKTSTEAAVEAPKDLHPASLPKLALSLSPNHLASGQSASATCKRSISQRLTLKHALLSSEHIVSDKLYSGFVEHLGRGMLVASSFPPA